MNKKTFWIIGIIITLAACRKEKFPDTKNLKGTWIEQTNNSFKHKLLFEQDVLYFIQQNTIDTFSYRLNKKEGYMYLALKNYPSASESYHKLLFNKKNSTLTVWGLFPYIPEKVSEAKFKKE